MKCNIGHADAQPIAFWESILLLRSNWQYLKQVVAVQIALIGLVVERR